MIIYNVTLNVEEGIVAEWLQWMQQIHIPEVMATGCFTGHRFMRLLTTGEGEEGSTFAVMYELESMDDYVRYQNEFAPEMRGKGEALFGNRFYAFRTLLETIE